MKHPIHFQIQKLESEKLTNLVESITVFVFCLFLALFLPNLLYTYLYADQALLQEPMLMTMVPVVSFGLGVAYFIYVMLMNWRKTLKIKKLVREMDEMGCPDCLDDADLAEVESIVDEILAEAEAKPKAKSSKPKAKKTTKKAAVKKKASKK